MVGRPAAAHDRATAFAALPTLPSHSPVRPQRSPFSRPGRSILTPTRAAAVNTGPVQGRPQGLVLTAASTTARWRKTGAENHHHQALRSSRPSKGPLARPSKSVIVLIGYQNPIKGAARVRALCDGHLTNRKRKVALARLPEALGLPSEIVERALIEATYTKDRLQHLQQANLGIEKLPKAFATARVSAAGPHGLGFLLLALFANSLRCNGASAAEGRPSVARLASSRQPVTQSGPNCFCRGIDHREQCLGRCREVM